MHAVSPFISQLTIVCNDLVLPHHQVVEMLTQVVQGVEVCLISFVGSIISVVPFRTHVMYLHRSDTQAQERQM
jgi:hypothetical protein